MKRLIKYHNKYSSDKMNFSTCSTYYEILPFLVEDNANNKDLIAYADALGYERVGNVKTLVKKSPGHHSSLTITHAVKLNEIAQGTGMYDDEQYQVYLGFITINSSSEYNQYPLIAVESINNTMSQDQACEIRNNQEFGVSGTGLIESDMYMVMESWDYFHDIPLMGYSLEKLEQHLGCTESTFSDEVTTCHECNEWMFNSDDYTYNFRIVDCTLLGLECGCYHTFTKNRYLEFVNDSEQCIELDIAEELESEGKLEFVERFIGGMTDGRGGSYGGQSAREGKPGTILEELIQENPDASYIFTHDESGQFQTYFSVWRVKTENMEEVA